MKPQVLAGTSTGRCTMGLALIFALILVRSTLYREAPWNSAVTTTSHLHYHRSDPITSAYPAAQHKEFNNHFDTSEISTVVNGDVCKLYTLSDMSILEAAHAHTRLMRARQADLTVAQHINL